MIRMKRLFNPFFWLLNAGWFVVGGTLAIFGLVIMTPVWLVLCSWRADEEPFSEVLEQVDFFPEVFREMWS